MKKALFTVLAASMFLTVGCIKDNTVVVLPDPATKEQAVSIQFDKGQTLMMELPDREIPNDPSSAKPNSIEQVEIVAMDLSESNRYVLYIGEKNSKASAKPQIVWMGKFKFNSGRYILDGFGDVLLKENNMVTVIPVSTKADNGEITLPANVKPIIQQTYRSGANLARNWKVKSVYVKVVGGKNNVSAARNFDGCDLHSIASYLMDKNVPISQTDLDNLSGYSVSEINFIGNNDLIINFNGPQSYYGTWTIDGSGNFTWDLDNASNNVIAKATGSVSFPANANPILSVNVKINDNGEQYTGTAEFTLESVQ